MHTSTYSVITGTGSYIPTRRIRNEDFLDNTFYDKKGEKIQKSNREIIEKFKEITTISERRYVTDDLVTSDIATFAAEKAIDSAGIDPETLDHIIVAHNFGDVKADDKQVDIVPSIAARVKYNLEIESPFTLASDIPFGCPGWLQAVIHADAFVKSGQARKLLVIGAEILSRVSDPHDRDSMLYSDGAGAIVLEALESEKPIGILAHSARSDTITHSKLLYMGASYHPVGELEGETFMKMNGRKLYQYALKTVPSSIKKCLDQAGIDLRDISKMLLHQANGKMDDAIIHRLYKLYGIDELPEHIMPMTIEWLGNASVATLPTLLDLIMKDQLKPHTLTEGDTIVFASVGAGMNINALIYQF